MGHVLAAHHDGLAGLHALTSGAGHRAGGDRPGAKQSRQDSDGCGAAQLVAQASQVSARDMAGLVSEDAYDLVRRSRLKKDTGIDEDAATVDDESVELRRVDHHDPDVRIAEPRSAKDRCGIIAEQPLDLGVTDETDALLGGGIVHLREGSRQADGGRKPEPADNPSRSRQTCPNESLPEGGSHDRLAPVIAKLG